MSHKPHVKVAEDLSSFELYGMEYTPHAEYYKHGDMIEVIPAGECLKGRLANLLSKRGIRVVKVLEKIAREALCKYFSVVTSKDAEALAHKHMCAPHILVSLPYGSICGLTIMGDINNLVCKDPRDILILNRIVKQFPVNTVIVEVGSVTWGIVERLGFDVLEIQGDFAICGRRNGSFVPQPFRDICKDLIIWQTSTHLYSA